MGTQKNIFCKDCQAPIVKRGALRCKTCSNINIAKTRKKRVQLFGEKHPCFKGIKKDNGYTIIYQPKHPRAKRGYIMRSIFIMEKKIGRKIKNDEVVHHINSKRSDDRIKNLKLMKKKEHQRYHAEKNGFIKKKKIDKNLTNYLK